MGWFFRKRSWQYPPSISDPNNPFGWNNTNSPNNPFGWNNMNSPNNPFGWHRRK